MPVAEMEKENSALSLEEFFRSAVKKIDQNTQEQKEFEMKLHALLKGDKRLASAPLTVCTTTYALAICGADENMPLIITKKVIDKAMRPEIRDKNGRLTGKTGHELTEEQIANALNELKNPTMIFKGSQEDSLLAITEIEDNKGRNIVVAIDLNKKENFRVVNRIRSSYGRDNLSNYLVQNIENDNLLAVNAEKADKMLRSIGKSYPKENTFISFDNSIAYTTAYVKYPEKNIAENTLECFDNSISYTDQNVKPLQVGDKIQYNGEKYTVTSLKSDIPNCIQITQNDDDGLDYTYDIDKNKLLSHSSFVYLEQGTQPQQESVSHTKEKQIAIPRQSMEDDYEDCDFNRSCGRR